jgi:hypothetical protein
MFYDFGGVSGFSQLIGNTEIHKGLQAFTSNAYLIWGFAQL